MEWQDPGKTQILFLLVTTHAMGCSDLPDRLATKREFGFQPSDFGFRRLRESRTMRFVELVAPAGSDRDWKSDSWVTIQRCFTTTRKPCQARRSH